MLSNRRLSLHRLILVIAIVSALIVGLLVVREARKPDPIPNYSSSERSSEVTIVIPEGATGDKIAKILFEAGVVKSARAFFAAATENELSQSIQPGTYRIDSKIPGSQAVEQLLDKQRRMLVLLIREGERAYEFRNDLLRLKFSSADISKVFDQKIDVNQFGKQDFEGFAFPATYNLIPNETIDGLRDRLLAKFGEVTNRINFVAGARDLGLDPYQALIIASIVQAEGFDDEDFGKVARVIYNRIAAKMPLQMDSTNLYALKERRLAVTSKDLQISSLYNSYNRLGLPPTPIGNPGEKALLATINPAEGDWLYFVTVAPTETKFTNSYSEFLRYKKEFKANLKAGLFDGKQ